MVRSTLLVLLAVSALAQKTTSQRAAWNRPFPPFRIAGELYYVGASGVSAFLIHTPAGLILLDGGLEETAPLIEINIAALGFRVRDIKILLNSHAHFDHCGGLAELKRLSGAQMVASRGDSGALTSGRQPNLGPGVDYTSPPVKVDRIIDDGAKVQLGDLTLTARLTPGHTPGCTTWTMPLPVDGKTLNVVFDCSTSVPGWTLVHNRKYPAIASDYERSFATLRTLPCDIFLAPHPSFFKMEEKRARMKPGAPNPFINPGELRAFNDDSEKSFLEELEKQQRYTR